MRSGAANAIQQKFDSKLDIIVPVRQADATSATLSITLLSTNRCLRDPERFCSYSGSPEVLAVLNRDDAYFLNTLQHESVNFVSTAPAAEITPELMTNDADSPAMGVASWSYFPSAQGWYMVAYEDSLPSKGDYGFTDLVVGYPPTSAA